MPPVSEGITFREHSFDLLTEALRQRDACQSGVCSEIEMLRAEVERLRHWREDESASFGMSREVCQALCEERDAAIGKAEFWKTSDEAWVNVAGRTMAVLGEPNSSDLIGVAERARERAEKAERALDEARAVRDQRWAMAKSATLRAISAEERAERAEALLQACLVALRNVQVRIAYIGHPKEPFYMDGETRVASWKTVVDEDQELMAKIREVIG